MRGGFLAGYRFVDSLEGFSVSGVGFGCCGAGFSEVDLGFLVCFSFFFGSVIKYTPLTSERLKKQRISE